MARNAKFNPARSNWFVDVVLAIVFLVVLSPSFTGRSIHEWLGLAVGGTVIVHLLLHWDWILTTTTRFLRQINTMARINYIVNSLLLILLTVAVLSGLMISQSISQVFGYARSGNSIWREIHATSASLLLILIGVHLALNWKWVVHSVAQFVVSPMRQLFGSR